MADTDRELQELRREVIEARNLVIKTDNLLKNLQADVKRVSGKQEAFEKRSWANGATAYILFMTLSALGAYMFARGAIDRNAAELVSEQTARKAADNARDEALAAEAARVAASKKALVVWDALVGTDIAARDKAVEEALAFDPSQLTPFEAKALNAKALSLRQAVADAALDAGRSAFNRKNYAQAADELDRHWKLSPKGPEDVALLLLGQSLHALKRWDDAAKALKAFLDMSPNSRSADYVTLIYGEALAESGHPQEAIEVYEAGARKFSSSQFASWMRTRAKRLKGD